MPKGERAIASSRSRDQEEVFVPASVYLSYSGRGGDPAAAVEEYFASTGVKRIVIARHPLLREESGGHELRTIVNGAQTRSRTLQFPHVPPFTFLVDMIIDFFAPASQIWVGFNPLATNVGLLHRMLGRAKLVVHYSIDFTPDRFSNRLLNTIYRFLDRISAKYSDIHVELNNAMRVAREREYSLGQRRSRVLVIPMGTRPTTSTVEISRRPGQLVFLGSLEERMGVELLPFILEAVRQEVSTASLLVIGDGPYRLQLESVVYERGLGAHTSFCGYIESEDTVHELLRTSMLALAPYVPEPGNFSYYADPGKLKAYVSAGLPVVLTDVPPNARELKDAGLGFVSEFDAEQIARHSIDLLIDQARWHNAHESALKYSREYSWHEVLRPLLDAIANQLRSKNEDPLSEFPSKHAE